MCFDYEMKTISENIELNIKIIVMHLLIIAFKLQ